MYTPDMDAERLGPTALCLGLVGRLLYAYPERDWLQALLDEDLLTSAPLAAEHPDTARGLALMREWAAAVGPTLDPAALDDLRADYTGLFLGPGKVLAPPWESVYFSEERLLFQGETHAVRDWYARFGMRVEHEGSEPDDHIGLELLFLAELAGRELEAIEQGRIDMAVGPRAARRDFAAAHPARWVGPWCEQVLQHGRTHLYRGAALVARGLLSTPA